MRLHFMSTTECVHIEKDAYVAHLILLEAIVKQTIYSHLDFSIKRPYMHLYVCACVRVHDRYPQNKLVKTLTLLTCVREEHG
jgi:hypothetical protein